MDETALTSEGLGPVRIGMTRADLGSFLSLKLETVTRALSRLDARGLISVERREILIRDETGRIVNSSGSMVGMLLPELTGVLRLRNGQLEAGDISGPFSGGSIGTRQVAPWYSRIAVFVVCLLICVVAARGTLRQGPPMRWGDVYTTDSNFANHLGLNGTLSLIGAAKARFSEHRENVWKATLEQPLATQTVRDMLVLPEVITQASAVAALSSPKPRVIHTVRLLRSTPSQAWRVQTSGKRAGKGQGPETLPAARAASTAA